MRGKQTNPGAAPPPPIGGIQLQYWLGLLGFMLSFVYCDGYCEGYGEQWQDMSTSNATQTLNTLLTTD